MTDAELDALIAYARSMPEGWSLHKYADAIAALREQVENCKTGYAQLLIQRSELEADNAALRQALKEFLDVLAYAERDGIKEGIKRAYDMGRAALLAGKSQ